MVPKISIVLPVFNCERYLPQAIESLIQQTFRNFELILVNDGSTDRSLSICLNSSRSDSRVKILSRANTGISQALNDGINLASGEYIARMDGDDIASHDRLEKQYQFAKENPNVIAFGSYAEFIDPSGSTLKSYKPPTSHDSIEKELRCGNGGAILHPTLFAKRKSLSEAGFYRDEYKFIEDLDLYIRLSKIGNLANIQELCLRYRMHKESTNHKKAEQQNKLRRDLLKESYGIDLPSPNKSPVTSHHLNWCYMALEGGNYKTAIRHAVLSIAKNPSSANARRGFKYTIHTVFNRRKLKASKIE